MVGRLEKIERDLAAMEESLATIAAEFRSVYEGYLNVLGQAMRQQLILACYHLCTQGYPEAFLKLSFSQRQSLQQGFRQLATACQEEWKLLINPTPAPTSAETPETLETSETSENTPAISPPVSNPAEALSRWQEHLETSLVKSLRTLSRDANRLLQQLDILPKKLPEPVLEVAAKAEPSEVAAGPPNLLSIIVETDESEDSPNGGGNGTTTAMHILAIHLRLPEIEFSEASLSPWRQQIRNLSARLHTLRREYQKKQRERAVVEAEAAWRASWFED